MKKPVLRRRVRPNTKSTRSFFKVWAGKIAEQFTSEFNLTLEQRSAIRDEVVRKLHGKRDEMAHDKAMKEVIVKYKAILRDRSKTQLCDVKRALTNMQYKLVKAEQQYDSERDSFESESNADQQAKYKEEQQVRNKARLESGSTTVDTNSGNIQFTISLKEIEGRVNQYLEEHGYPKRNLNDSHHKVFIDGRVGVFHDSLGGLVLEVPVKIDNKRMAFSGKVTQFNAVLRFNVQLVDSSADKMVGVHMDASHKLSKKPYYELFATFPLVRVGSMASEQMEPALHQAISNLREEIDSVLFKEVILNRLEENLPKGVVLKPGIVDVRPRVDDGNLVFDIDFNADFRCQIPPDSLKDVFTGYSMAGCRLEKISSIQMSEGRVQVEIPISGLVSGSVVGSFDLIFCPERQCFSFSNLSVRPQDNASALIKFFSCGINCLQGVLSGRLEGYINNNLENIRLFAISNAEKRLQEETPGNLVIDADSIIINNIYCDNNITLDISLRSCI